MFNSYGRRDNQHLLLHYGFAMPHNEWDVFEVVLGIDTMFANRRTQRTKPRKEMRSRKCVGGVGSVGAGSSSDGSDGGGMMDGTEDDDEDVVTKGLESRVRRLARWMRPRAKFKFRNRVFQWELLRLFRLVRVRLSATPHASWISKLLAVRFDSRSLMRMCVLCATGQR